MKTNGVPPGITFCQQPEFTGTLLPCQRLGLILFCYWWIVTARLRPWARWTVPCSFGVLEYYWHSGTVLPNASQSVITRLQVSHSKIHLPIISQCLMVWPGGGDRVADGGCCSLAVVVAKVGLTKRLGQVCRRKHTFSATLAPVLRPSSPCTSHCSLQAWSGDLAGGQDAGQSLCLSI